MGVSGAAGGTAIVPGSVGRTSIALMASYDIGLLVRYGPGTIALSSTMSVVNDSGGPVDRVELETIAARLGHMTLGAVAVDGRRVMAMISDQTIVVPLGGILPAGASVTIRLSYRATLRRDLAGSDWLFTKANGIVDLYRFIPWISLRRRFDRPNYGDPFFTASSPRVRLTVTTDRPLTIAATGHRVAGSRLVQVFEASDVRDLTVTASPFYRVTSSSVGSTTVRVIAKAGYPTATVLRYARSFLAREGDLVGR